MNGGILPMILLCATLGLALAPASRRAAWFGFTGLVVGALVAVSPSLPQNLFAAVTAGLWLSLIGTAAFAFLAQGSTDRWRVAAGINAGLWTGAFASLSGQHAALLLAVPLGLIFLLGRWFVDRGYPIVVKVVASWMIAIASLAIFVSLLPTPGYRPDHMQ